MRILQRLALNSSGLPIRVPFSIPVLVDGGGKGVGEGWGRRLQSEPYGYIRREIRTDTPQFCSD